MTGLFNLECGGRMFININETLHYDRERLNLYAESWNVRKFAKTRKLQEGKVWRIHLENRHMNV